MISNSCSSRVWQTRLHPYSLTQISLLTVIPEKLLFYWRECNHATYLLSWNQRRDINDIEEDEYLWDKGYLSVVYLIYHEL